MKSCWTQACLLSARYPVDGVEEERPIRANALRPSLRHGERGGLNILTIQVLNARAQAISLEDANPRHEHEWAVFQAVRLPDDNILTTGVLDSTTNFIEHPELVAQRLVRYAEVVGKENVIAGSDCGFATCARTTFQVEPESIRAKLCAMAEGA